MADLCPHDIPLADYCPRCDCVTTTDGCVHGVPFSAGCAECAGAFSAAPLFWWGLGFLAVVVLCVALAVWG